MAVEKLSTTTLSAALDENTNDFFVASTTNINVGDYVVCRAEAMKVQDVPSSTRLKVKRGVGGTLSRAHPSGQRFFVGSPDKFQAIKQSATSRFGDSGTYPEFMLPGQRGKDGDGNEYVLLAPTAQVYTGFTVLISKDGLFTCEIAYIAKQGSVAVVVEAATSDQYVWGQIYGFNAYCQDAFATLAATSTGYLPMPQTSATAPSPGMALNTFDANGIYVISAMFIVGAAKTSIAAASSATGVGVPVWLNYPFLEPYGVVTLTSGAP